MLSSSVTQAQSAQMQKAAPASYIRELGEMDCPQALALLTAQPMQGVHLESLINDHGITSPALRGCFYGHFVNDQLVGLALVGHQIMFCAPNESIPPLALAAAASKACTSVIFGPQQQVELFWQHYATAGRELKLQRNFYWYV